MGDTAYTRLYMNERDFYPLLAEDEIKTKDQTVKDYEETKGKMDLFLECINKRIHYLNRTNECLNNLREWNALIELQNNLRLFAKNKGYLNIQ
jgi:uncharacterized protein YwgA